MSQMLKLQHSESVVCHVASRIYAAYISSGRVASGEEKHWIKRSIKEAIDLCVATDEAVSSDDEVKSMGF